MSKFVCTDCRISIDLKIDRLLDEIKRLRAHECEIGPDGCDCFALAKLTGKEVTE